MKKIENVAFAILAATILFTIGSCQKSDPEFSINVSTYIIQTEVGTNDYVYDLYFGVLGYNDIIQDGSVSITLNNTPILGVSNIPGSYEKVPTSNADIKAFNGTYGFQATSINSKSAFFSASFTFQDTPLDKFTVENFKYEDGRVSAIFKNIDPNAIICGFYINPIIDGVPLVSRMYALSHRENIIPEEGERSVTASIQMLSEYDGLRIYPMIGRANSSILQIFIGDILQINSLD
jgi:hypothetical protein